MRTKIIKIDELNDINFAAELIKSGELVAFPTETVYGLGANAMNETAVKKIFTAKDRPADNPLIVHIADHDSLRTLALEIPETASRLIKAFWPGPLSLVFLKNSNVPDITTGNLNTVVVRQPKHPIAQALIRAAGVPIAAPSANTSGRVSPTSAAHVYQDLEHRIPLIIDGGQIEYGIESTVVDCTVFPPVILRPGSVTLSMLQSICPEIKSADETTTHKSPGMKYRHYAPTAPIILFTGKPIATETAIQNYISKHLEQNNALICHTGNFDINEQTIKLSPEPELAAPALFATLRSLDNLQPDTILIQGYKNSGVGAAIMNRLSKAATQTIEV